MWASEAVPEHSILAGPGDPEYFVAYRSATPGSGVDGYFNWTLPDGAWDPGLHPAPDPPQGDSASDPWTTTFGAVGADLIMHLTLPGHDVAVFGTTPATLAGGGDAVFPARIVDRFSSSDGPSVVADLSGRFAYTAYATFAGLRTITVEGFGPCNTRVLADPGCPHAWNEPLVVATASAIAGHPRVAINPCTHRLLVGVRMNPEFGSPARAVVYVVTPEGGVIDALVVDEFSSSKLSSCSGAGIDGQIPRCGMGTGECRIPGGSECLEVVQYVDLGVLWDTSVGQCLLFAAYGITDGATDRAFVRFAVVDVTSDTPLNQEAIVELGEISGATTVDRDFLPTVVVDVFSGAAGIFFYRQEGGDPCDTTFRGRVRLGGDSTWQDVGPLSGPFPSIVGDPNGLGHYVRGTHFTRPGRLFVAWAEPVPTTDPACPTCQGSPYSLVVRGREVMP